MVCESVSLFTRPSVVALRVYFIWLCESVSSGLGKVSEGMQNQRPPEIGTSTTTEFPIAISMPMAMVSGKGSLQSQMAEATRDRKL